MARSFFERLTGSMRLGEEPTPPAGDHSWAPAPVRKRKRDEESEGGGQVLHPVQTDEPRPGAEPAGAAPDEEGQLTVDIFDDGVNLVIQSTVAGVKPEDIDISLQDETLTIRGSRKRSQEITEDNFYYKELYWGAFSRSIILPEEVDFQKADAAIKHGMLTIKLPKKDRGEKKIKVKIGD